MVKICYVPAVAGAVTVAVLLAGLIIACGPASDATRCRRSLEAKRDSVATCGRAYARTPTIEAATRLVAAYHARGPGAVEALLATQPTGPLAAEAWHVRGGDLRAQGEVDRAIDAFDRALAARAQSDRIGRLHELAALSERYSRRGDMREALSFQARTYELAVELGDPLVLGHVRVNLASQLLLLGDFASAERALGDATSQLLPSDPYRASALLMSGTIQLSHHRPRLAMTSFEQAFGEGDDLARQAAAEKIIDAALELGELEHVAVPLASLRDSADHAFYSARIALARGQGQLALRQTELGLASRPDPTTRWLLETLRGRALVELRQLTAATVAFERSIAIVEHDIDELEIDELKSWALRRAERRAPYEQLFTLYVRSGRFADALALVQRIAGRALFDGLVARGAEAPSTATVADAARASGERAEAMKVIAHSLRASATGPALGAKALASELASRVVWTYVVADGELWLVALDHGVASADDLGSLATLREDIEASVALRPAALERLGTVLAPAVRWQHLAPRTVLYIAADSPLDSVPFAALTVQGTRWVERTALASIPSAAVLTMLLRDSAGGRGVTVVGDPDGDLPGARGEAEDTARRFDVAAQIGGGARSSVVLSSGNARLLSIAAHTNLVAAGASLQLADRAITSAEIVDRGIAPRLVVLASCASGAVDSDAWGALAGGFMAAGTPTVIASRWALGDASSRRLVAAFYAADGIDHPALALAISQRQAIAHRVPERAWAALVALGTGETPTEMKEKAWPDNH